MIVMKKAEGAFLTISELAEDLGLPQHILRYWETRFPQLKPLQRSGNRRYYRPADVDLARRIHRLLNVEGFTVKGAQKALSDKNDGAAQPQAPSVNDVPTHATQVPVMDTATMIARLESIRDQLAGALKD